MTKPVGSIGWLDLTVEDAPKVRDFYRDVVGWTTSEIDMGGYADYVMSTPEGEAAAGVCHARGNNAGLPSSWLVYVIVADIERSVERARELGGKTLTPIRSAGGGKFAVIADPAGAVLALFQDAAG